MKLLKRNLYDYNDTYILVRGDITTVGDNGAEVEFKNCAPFTKCITKIDGTITDDSEDLDLVMPMYNLLEYSSNYYDTTGSLWFILKMKELSLMLILWIMLLLILSRIKLN